jgi:hypothetical protein
LPSSSTVQIKDCFRGLSFPNWGVTQLLSYVSPLKRHHIIIKAPGSGFEPLTDGLTARRSTRLSYPGYVFWYACSFLRMLSSV